MLYAKCINIENPTVMFGDQGVDDAHVPEINTALVNISRTNIWGG